MKKNFIFIFLIFLIISVSVISGIIFNDKLIGRSLDFPLTPVSYLNSNIYLRNFYSWWGSHNGGARNPFGAALIPVNSILYFPILLGAGPWFIARYQIVLALLLAMFFFYLLSKRILEEYNIKEKNRIFVSILGALFFTLNNYFFCEIMFGSNAMYLTFSFVPLLLYSIISYYKTARKKLFFILSLLSLVIISSTLQHLVLAYFSIIILSIIYKDIKLFIKLGLGHFLFSLYWVIPMLCTVPEITKGPEMISDYTANFTISAPSLLSSVINKEYVFRRNLYNLALNSSFLSLIWVFNAFLLLITSFFCLLKPKIFKKEHRKIIFGFSIVFLASLLFFKGANKPFGGLILFLYKNFPVLSLYRSTQHFLSFYVIAISILFIFSGLFFLKKNKRFLYLLTLLIFINAMPWWYTLDLGTKNITSTNYVPSYFGQFYLTEGNEKMYALNKLPLDFGILHIPPGYSINFLAVGKNEFNFITYQGVKIHTQGVDAGLAFGNKKFYAADSRSFVLIDILGNLEKDMYVNPDFFNKNRNLFPILNIRYFVLREDVSPIFSENTGFFNIKNVKQAINKSNIFSSIEKEDFVTIINIKNEYFLPHLYASKILIATNQTINDLPQIVSEPNYQIRSVIYFENQNKDRIQKLNQLPNIIENTPILEFKRINPTKLRVVVHQARGNFPLVFSENFHRGWKIYPLDSKLSIRNLKLNNLSDGYEILDGNEGDRATKKELENYIEKGWISMLEKDFVSKNFQDTIQNDNLSKGHIWDTWFKKSLPEENHLMANGYANSWWIDPEEVCKVEGDKVKSFCHKNPDGSYDFELIIEFWPQRLFYLGLLISGLTLISFIGYLIWDWRRK